MYCIYVNRIPEDQEENVNVTLRCKVGSARLIDVSKKCVNFHNLFFSTTRRPFIEIERRNHEESATSVQTVI